MGWFNRSLVWTIGCFLLLTGNAVSADVPTNTTEMIQPSLTPVYTLNVTVEEVERKHPPNQNQGLNLMAFTDLISSNIKGNVCLELNTSVQRIPGDINQAMGCVMFGDSIEAVIDCIDDNNIDKMDPGLNDVIFVLPGSACSFSPLRVICATLFPTMDFASKQQPLTARLCVLDHNHAKQIGNGTQSVLQRLAEDMCGSSFNDGQWHFSLEMNVRDCHVPFDPRRKRTSGEATTVTSIKILSGIGLSMELLCILLVWRDVIKSNSIVTVLVIISIADIFALASIMIRCYGPTAEGVKGYQCLLADCFNYFGTILCSLAHMQITFNRFIAVLYPFKVKIWCTYRINMVVLVVFFCVGAPAAVLLCLPRIFSDAYRSLCELIQLEHDPVTVALITTYFVIFICVPVLLVAVWSICIIIKLILVNHDRRTLSTNAQELPNVRINLSLLVTVVLFLVLVLPLAVAEVLVAFFSSISFEMFKILKILVLVRCTSGSVNMFIRLLFVAEYRNKCIQAFKALKLRCMKEN